MEAGVVYLSVKFDGGEKNMLASDRVDEKITIVVEFGVLQPA